MKKKRMNVLQLNRDSDVYIS